MQERVGEKWSSPQSSFHAKILDTTFSSQALEKEEALFSWSIMFSHVQMGGFFCMFTRSLASYGSTPFSPPPFLLLFCLMEWKPKNFGWTFRMRLHFVGTFSLKP